MANIPRKLIGYFNVFLVEQEKSLATGPTVLKLPRCSHFHMEGHFSVSPVVGRNDIFLYSRPFCSRLRVISQESASGKKEHCERFEIFDCETKTKIEHWCFQDCEELGFSAHAQS